jgi:hypothetical protein
VATIQGFRYDSARWHHLVGGNCGCIPRDMELHQT